MSLLSLVLSLTLTGAPACEGERVVFVPLQPVALATSEAREVEDTVRRAAEGLPGLCLEPRADTVARLRARGGRLAGCSDAACRGAQVLALGADRVLRGVALGVGGGRGVALTLVDKEGLESHGIASLSGEGLAAGLEAGRAREVLESVWTGRHAPREVKRARTAWPTVLLGAGGVALAAGVGFGLAARQSQNALSTGNAGCGGEGEAFRACFAGRLAEGRQRSLAANVLLGTGALLGAGGAVLFVWELP